MKFKKIALITTLSLLFAGSALAKAPTAESIKKAIPDIDGKIYSIKQSPVKGIYEIVTQEAVLYATEDLKYIFSGHLLDVTAKKDLTEEPLVELQQKEMIRQLAEAESMKGDIKKDLEANQKNFISEVKGNGSKILYMVTDIRCSYCKKMEQTLDALTDVTIYRIPVAFLGPQSKEMAEKAWCSKDKLMSWRDGVAGKPLDAPTCAAPVASNTGLTKKWKVTGTPTLFLADGERWSRGYLGVEDTKLFMEKGASALLQKSQNK